MSAHTWQYNGATVDNFPGNAHCESLGHLLAEPIELGWRVEFGWDSNDPDHLAWRLEQQITDRLMEALD
jgi:hypothetical protein